MGQGICALCKKRLGIKSCLRRRKCLLELCQRLPKFSEPRASGESIPLKKHCSSTTCLLLGSFCSVVTRLRAPPLSDWLIRRTLEGLDPRQSWAGVLGASGRGSVVPSVSALYLADPQEVGAQGWLALV